MLEEYDIDKLNPRPNPYAEQHQSSFPQPVPAWRHDHTRKILKRVPEGCDAVYIKPEENKAHQVNVDESGAVDLR
jgi:hypothetical protein